MLDLTIIKLGILPYLEHSVHIFRYLDDVLILARDVSLLSSLAKEIPHHLTAAGLIISPKSSLTPAQSLTWLGKQLDMRTRSITPTHNTLIRTLGICVLFPLLPLHKTKNYYSTSLAS